jgi:hypothetical protein
LLLPLPLLPVPEKKLVVICEGRRHPIKLPLPNRKPAKERDENRTRVDGAAKADEE